MDGDSAVEVSPVNESAVVWLVHVCSVDSLLPGSNEVNQEALASP